MKIKLVTDSGCDLPQSLIEKYSVDVMPILILEGENEYLDKVDIMPETVLENMEKGIVYKTAQIHPNAFIENFTESIEKGEAIIYLSLSSELSGTYESALIAKKELEEKYSNADINIIDTKSVSGGQGFLVLEVAKMLEKNIDKELILKTLDNMIENIEHIFTIDNIEYLYRGGRVSRAQNIMGGLLDIKPILCVREGKLVPVEKVRGKNKVLKSMVDMVERIKKDTKFEEQTIIIIHGNDLESAEKLKEMIIESLGARDVLINSIGAVIGAHAGPGTLGVFFLKKNIPIK